MRIFQQTFVIFFALLLSHFSFAQIAFSDISTSVGTMEMGGHNIGISFCDYNQDNLEDFYVVCRTGPNHFYKNLGDGLFMEIGEEMGLDFRGNSRMAVWGDLNNDGFEEVYVGNMNEADVLYLNNGDGTFTDITIDAGITNDDRVFSVNMADVNEDGWLDIYISNSQGENVLYLNQGENNIAFIDYTEEAGLIDTRLCMGAVFFDMDNDGDEDMYMTHDANIPNTLYENDGTGHFKEIAEAAGVAYKGNGMGVDAGDLNNDGFLDLYVTNLYKNVLFINNGDNTFSDMTATAYVGDIGMGWGASIFDFNNDGLNDIYIGNDSYFYPLPNLLYQNKGNYNFTALAADAPVSSMQGTYGVATGDLNNDGVQDLALANLGSKDNAQIFKNELSAGNWIGFNLEGVESNRSAIGTRVEIIDNNGELHVDQVTAGNGYAGQNTKRIHFGFGSVSSIKSIKIIWPNGLVQEMEGLTLGTYYSIKEGGGAEVLFDGMTTSNFDHLQKDIIISVYPNPTSRLLQVKLPEGIVSVSSIKMIDIAGKIVFEQEDFTGRLIEIDLGGLVGSFELIFEIDGFYAGKQVIVF